jgi:hypothetical protein
VRVRRAALERSIIARAGVLGVLEDLAVALGGLVDAVALEVAPGGLGVLEDLAVALGGLVDAVALEVAPGGPVAWEVALAVSGALP